MTTVQSPSHPPRVLGNLRGADMILTAAHAGGLQMPATVTASTHSAMTFILATLADLTEWAIWAEATISTREVDDGQQVMHECQTEMFDQTVRLVAITPVPTAEHVIRVEPNDAEINKPTYLRSRRAVCSCGDWASGWYGGFQASNQARDAGTRHIAEVTA